MKHGLQSLNFFICGQTPGFSPLLVMPLPGATGGRKGKRVGADLPHLLQYRIFKMMAQ